MSNIEVSGTGVKWYDAASAGNEVAGTTTLVSGTTYYASQTITGCESTSRLAVTVTLSTPANITGQPQNITTVYCGSNTQSFTVTATGTSLEYQWFTCNSSGTGRTKIEGATSASYTPLMQNAGTYYYVADVISGACTTSTRVASYTVTAQTALPAV